jgi:hypothetical protein
VRAETAEVDKLAGAVHVGIAQKTGPNPHRRSYLIWA